MNNNVIYNDVIPTHGTDAAITDSTEGICSRSAIRASVRFKFFHSKLSFVHGRHIETTKGLHQMVAIKLKAIYCVKYLCMLLRLLPKTIKNRTSISKQFHCILTKS